MGALFRSEMALIIARARLREHARAHELLRDRRLAHAERVQAAAEETDGDEASERHKRVLAGFPYQLGDEILLVGDRHPGCADEVAEARRAFDCASDGVVADT